MNHQSDAAGSKEAQPLPLSSSPSRPAKSVRITAIQARMARAALGCSLAEVATATGCALTTISRIENDGVVSGKNAIVIRRYYEERGVQFIADAYYHSVRAPK